MPYQLPRSVLPSVSAYQSGVLGGGPPPAPAFRSGSLGGGPPPAPAFRSGSLGTPPVSGAVKSGVLGVFGQPPPSGAFRSGSLGVLGTPPPSGAVKSGVLGTLGGGPPPAPAYRSGSLGVFGESYAGLGEPGSIMPHYHPIGDATSVNLAAMYGLGFPTMPAVPKLVVAAAGLGAVAVIWWAMTRRHAKT